MPKIEQFPKRLFVIKEQYGDKVFFVACETPRECADVNEEQIVGVYALVETRKLSVEIVLGESENR